MPFVSFDVERAPAAAPLAVRQVWPGERHVVERHLLRLSPEDRHLRFGRPASDAFIREYARGLLTSDCIVKAAYVDGVCRGIGEVHILRDGDYDAEAALSVERPWQGRGIGDALLKRLTLAAGNRGCRRIVIFCLHENRRMLGLARRNNAILSVNQDGVVGEFRRPRGTPFTWQQELLEEGLGVSLVIPVIGPREPG